MIKHIELYESVYFEAGLISLKRLELYRTDDIEDDEFIIYDELKPAAYFTFNEEHNGIYTRELLRAGKINNVQIADFVNNFLKYTTAGKLSIRPIKRRRVLIKIKTTKQKKAFELPYYNIDKDWENLSETGIQKIVKMSKSTLNRGRIK